MRGSRDDCLSVTGCNARHRHFTRIRSDCGAEACSTKKHNCAADSDAKARRRAPQSLLSLSSGPLTDTCSFRLPLPMAHAVAARRRRRARGRPTFTQEEEGKMAHLLICLARRLTSFDDSYPSLTPAITGNLLSTIIEYRSSPFKLTSNDQIAQEGSENQNTGPLA